MALNEGIAYKRYEFDAHGVERNQRYRSDGIVADGQMEPDFTLDADLHYQPTTWPGARIPHVWLFDAAGDQHSTLDLAGHGVFTLFTGLGGKGWAEAAKTVAANMGIVIEAHIIGPRQQYVDHTGDWARAREVGDAGCVIPRPDQHVCWRHDGGNGDHAGELNRVLRKIPAQPAG